MGEDSQLTIIVDRINFLPAIFKLDGDEFQIPYNSLSRGILEKYGGRK